MHAEAITSMGVRKTLPDMPVCPEQSMNQIMHMTACSV